MALLWYSEQKRLIGWGFTFFAASYVLPVLALWIFLLLGGPAALRGPLGGVARYVVWHPFSRVFTVMWCRNAIGGESADCFIGLKFKEAVFFKQEIAP